MKLTLSALLLAHLNAFCQTIETIGFLPSELQESSGLIYINNSLFSHNDSGGNSTIYELNQNSMFVERSIFVENASNIDWEDLAADESYLYIGDFGNNNGNRDNLRILRIQIDEILNNDTVLAEIIEFSYEDQGNFESQPLNTNFDCEAMIALNDSLILFTKNWLDLNTNIYTLPKDLGSWVAKRKGTLNVSTLISGADYNPNTNELTLIGYQFGQASLIKGSVSENQIWDDLSFVSEELVLSNSYQVEGVAYINDTCLALSSEGGFSGESALFRYCNEVPNYTMNKHWNEITIFPNPAHEFLHVELKQSASPCIINIQNQFGQIVLGPMKHIDIKTRIDVSHLSSGVYFVSLIFENELIKTRLIIQ